MARRRKQDSGWRRRRWRIAAWALLPLFLLVPLIAMQFSDTVDWTLFDFVVAAILFGGTGAMFEIAVRMSRHAAYRLASAIALLTAFLLIWVNLAVGVIGDAGNAANLLYAGLLALGLAGVLWVRFRPHGMARTLAAMAAAQTLVAAIVLVLGRWEAAMLTLVFAGLWLLSAGLFRNAAKDQASSRARSSAGPCP